MIELICSGGSTFTSCNVAKSSALIKDMFEDLAIQEETTEIPLEQFAKPVIDRVFEWCTYHSKATSGPLPSDCKPVVVWEQDFFDEISESMILEIIYASNYLEIEPLLDASCKQIAKRQQTPNAKSSASRVYHIPELNERISLEESKERLQGIRQNLSAKRLEMYDDLKSRGMMDSHLGIDSEVVRRVSWTAKTSQKNLQIWQDLRKEKAFVENEILLLQKCSHMVPTNPIEVALGLGATGWAR